MGAVIINFMVLGGPRSATTWAANWLTTNETVCLHDPLLEYTPAQLHRMTFPGGKRFGISCTSSMLYPDWVNLQKCPKLVLHRNVGEINKSLEDLGLIKLIPARHEARLASVKTNAMHIPYEYMFNTSFAAKISEFLGVPFDAHRYDIIRQMRIEPFFKHLNIGKEAAMQLVKRITEAR